MSDYKPAVYLTEIGLRVEVLRKLNQDYVFTLKGLNDAIQAGLIDALLTPEERAHVAERVASVARNNA